MVRWTQQPGEARAPNTAGAYGSEDTLLVRTGAQTQIGSRMDSDSDLLEKLQARTGKCIVVGCKDDCHAYAYAKKADGYETCVCGHTRWAHEN